MSKKFGPYGGNVLVYLKLRGESIVPKYFSGPSCRTIMSVK